MKSIVKEQLSQHGLSHLFCDRQYKSYSNKILKSTPGANRYYVALSVFDMFVRNARA